MFGLTFKYTDESKRVADSAQKAAFKNFPHAAAGIRKTAMGLIERSPESSLPGEPPHTRRGLFDRAMQFAADKDGAIVGLSFAIAGESGKPHEHGGEYKGQFFDERPFMQPALIENLSRFASSWEGSIGG